MPLQGAAQGAAAAAARVACALWRWHAASCRMPLLGDAAGWCCRVSRLGPVAECFFSVLLSQCCMRGLLVPLEGAGAGYYCLYLRNLDAVCAMKLGC